MRTRPTLLAVLFTACTGTTDPGEATDSGTAPGVDTAPGADTDPQPGADLLVDCPGRPDCAPSEDGALRAAAAVRSIVPTCFESWVDDVEDGIGLFTYQPSRDTWRDCGCDQLCPDDPGYPGTPDAGEGDGQFQASWMGGFQTGKPAMGVRGADLGFMGEGDGLEARVVVFDQGNTRIALVALDGLGWMNDDVRAMREAVAARAVDVDWVIVTSSHTHAGVDTMGIYGRVQSESGYDPVYAQEVYGKVADAVVEAVGKLTPVTLRYGQIDLNTHFPNGSANIIRDSRDPQIVDPRVGVVRLMDGASPLITLVHFANHPETMADDNALLSAGFIHALRTGIEKGTAWPDGPSTAGIGGTAVYIQGTVGGMMTSLGASVTGSDGKVYRSASYDKTDAIGMLLAEAVIGLTDLTPATDTTLRVAAKETYLPVINIAFQAMFALGVFDHRTVWQYDDTLPLGPDNIASVRTEVDLFDLGPIRMLTMPGEVLPENVIGGYDGTWTPPGGVLIDDDNPNKPDLSAAPPGPYLLDELGGAGLNWIVGLGNDEVGYIIPPYDFKLGRAEYLQEAEGDHYEETNSLGPDTWPTLEQAARELKAYVDGAGAE